MYNAKYYTIQILHINQKQYCTTNYELLNLQWSEISSDSFT